jgi:hypothetical protein
VRGLAATAEIHLLPLLDLKADRLAVTAMMGFVTKRQVLRPAAGAPVINAGLKGQRDWHPGINIHSVHYSSPSCASVRSTLCQNTISHPDFK